MLGGSCNPCCFDVCAPPNWELDTINHTDDRRLVLSEVRLTTDRFDLQYETLTLPIVSSSETRWNTKDDVFLGDIDGVAQYTPAPDLGGLRFGVLLQDVWTHTSTTGSITTTNSLCVVIQAGRMYYSNLFNRFIAGDISVVTSGRMGLQVIIFTRSRQSGEYGIISDSGITPLAVVRDGNTTPLAYNPDLNVTDVLEWSEQLCIWQRDTPQSVGQEVESYRLRFRHTSYSNTEWYELSNYSGVAQMAGVLADVIADDAAFAAGGESFWSRPNSAAGDRGTIPWSCAVTRDLSPGTLGYDEDDASVPSTALSFSVQSAQIVADTPVINEQFEVIPGPLSVAPNDQWSEGLP